MKKLFLGGCFLLCALGLPAQLLNEFKWQHRLVIVFAPTMEHPLLKKQLQAFFGRESEMSDRQLLVLRLTPGDTRQPDGSLLPVDRALSYYEYFGIDQESVALLLVGLDGTEKYRCINKLVEPAFLFNRIDQMPMRAAELRRRGKDSGGK